MSLSDLLPQWSPSARDEARESVNRALSKTVADDLVPDSRQIAPCDADHTTMVSAKPQRDRVAAVVLQVPCI